MTEVWPKADDPPIEVGVVELNRYPENYFAEWSKPHRKKTMDHSPNSHTLDGLSSA